MISREEGRKGRREREEACRRGCDVIIPRSLHFSTLSPSSTATLFSLSHPHTHTSDPAGGGVTLEQACESVSAETQDPLTPVCQVPPTCLKQGIWLHSECNREAMWDRRSGTGPFQEERNFPNPKIEREKKKKKIYEREKNLVHHTITLSQRAISIILLSLTPIAPVW